MFNDKQLDQEQLNKHQLDNHQLNKHQLNKHQLNEEQINEEQTKEQRLEQLLVQLEEHDESNTEPSLTSALPEEVSHELSKMRQALELLKVASQNKDLETPALAPAPTHPTAPADINPAQRYTFIRRLGQGGFGTVVLARDAQLERNVAVKLPRLDIFLTKHMVQRFLREAQNVAKLHHANIVPVLAIDDISEMPSIVYHFCDGPTLAQWLKETEGPISPFVVAKIGLLLAEAVQHAHSRGIIHRDLKPSNVLLEPATDQEARGHGFDENGTHWIPRIIDFGISKAIEEDSVETLTTGLIGTPQYMPPEQLAGRVKDIGSHSDVYSLGVILYELLTKSRPFAESTAVELLLKMRAVSSPSVRKRRPGVPRDLDAIVSHCLNVDERQRYPTASELASDLKNYLEYKPVSVRSQTQLQKLKRWSRRQPVIASLAAACVVLFVFGCATTTEYIRRMNLYADQLKQANTQLASALKNVEAEQQRADTHAQLATQHAQEIRQQLYAADLFAASQAHRDGDLTRYQSSLERQIVPEGEAGDLRDRAWEYLWQHGHRQSLVMPISKRPVYSVKLAHTSSLAALCGADGIVHIVDLSTRTEVISWPAMQGELNSARFSDDDRFLATTGDDGTVCMWDAQTGKLLNRFRAHPEQAHQVLFTSADTLLTAGNEPTIRFWNWRTGIAEGTLDQHKKTVQSISLSADKQQLYSASDDGTLCIWQLNTKSLVAQSPNFASRNVDVELSTNGEVLLWADVAGNVRRCSLASNFTDVERIAKLTDDPQAVALSPDGRRIAIASREGIIQVVQLDEKGQPVPEGYRPTSKWVTNHGRIYDLSFSADGNSLHSVGEDGAWKVWNPQPVSFTETLNLETHLNSSSEYGVSFEQFDSSSCIFTASSKFYRWNCVEKKVTQLGSTQEAVRRLVVHGGSGLVLTGHREGHVKCWRVHGDTLNTLWSYSWPASHEPISGLSYCDALKQVAVTFEGSPTIVLLDVADGQEMAQLRVPVGVGADNDGGILLSPDGKWLAAAFNGEVIIWDLKDGAARRLQGHKNTVSALCFHPCEPMLFSGSTDRTIRMWDLRKGTTQAVLRHHKNGITGLLMSPDGRTLLASDSGGVTGVWHPDAKKLLFELDVRDKDACLAQSWSGGWVFRRSESVFLTLTSSVKIACPLPLSRLADFIPLRAANVFSNNRTHLEGDTTASSQKLVSSLAHK